MKKQRWFWGLFFILSGILLIVSKLQLFSLGVSTWGLLFTIFFIAMFVQSVVYKNVFGSLFSLAFLAIIYDEALGIEALTPWTILLVAFFFGIGIRLLFHPKKNKKYVYEKNDFLYGEDTSSQDNSHIHIHTSLASSTKYVNADDFKSAAIQCRLGSLKVYFDHAKIQGNHADLYLDINLSGVELYIPKTWRVVNNVNCSMAGYEEYGKQDDFIEATLTLHGDVMKSSLTIYYV